MYQLVNFLVAVQLPYDLVFTIFKYSTNCKIVILLKIRCPLRCSRYNGCQFSRRKGNNSYTKYSFIIKWRMGKMSIVCSLTPNRYIHNTHKSRGPSWSWSCGSWMYNYLCNPCLGQKEICVFMVTRSTLIFASDPFYFYTIRITIFVV